ncbi:MAG: pyrroline-5-carboxylate reductase [Rhodospirillaceae bacterium]|nr:pyrroline-5-carboxylate reductase [Rhodospirillaceae bacterium]
MNHKESILLVGGGNMGQALLRGWLADDRAPDSIRVVDPAEQARSVVGSLGIKAFAGRPHSFRADVIVLAVKPHLVEGALQDYRDLADGEATLLTIAAGKTIGFYQDLLGSGAAIVRGMPNTPAAIGKGITALAANDVVGTAQRQLCESLMDAVGQVVWLEDDGLMDSVTAVSGSGPAYVFLLIECLVAAAEKVGFDRVLAERLALATVAGAGAYAMASGTDPAELRRQVTSPGGTTQAALEVLIGDSRALESLLSEAVQAATRRSRELA